MALTIAINELGDGSNKVAYVTLPANKIGVIDAMDKAKIFGETSLRISRCDEIPELVGFNFTEQPSLDELNFLAKRIEEISADKENIMPIIAYRALLRKPLDSIKEAINRTYDLETVPIYPCKNVYAYGEMVLENELFEDLNDLPDDIYKLLDPDKVGRAMMELEDGVFINEYYAVANSYEPALVYDDELPEPMDDWVFKIEIAGVPEKAEDFGRMKTETLMLPADEEHMQDIAEAVGEKNIDECISMRFESAIPQINNDMWSMEEIYLLNDIARDFLELSREDAVKFKAALESELPQSLDKIESIMKYLDNYEFNRAMDRKAYVEMILDECSCRYTDYGIISEYGGRLFPTNMAPQQEQASSIEIGGHCGI